MPAMGIPARFPGTGSASQYRLDFSMTARFLNTGSISQCYVMNKLHGHLREQDMDLLSEGALKNPFWHRHSAAPGELEVLKSGQSRQEPSPISVLYLPAGQAARNTEQSVMKRPAQRI